MDDLSLQKNIATTPFGLGIGVKYVGFPEAFFIKLRLTLDIRLDPEDISKSIIDITKNYTCMNYLGTINVNIDIKLFKSYMYHDGLKNLDEFDDIEQIV